MPRAIDKSTLNLFYKYFEEDEINCYHCKMSDYTVNIEGLMHDVFSAGGRIKDGEHKGEVPVYQIKGEKKNLKAHLCGYVNPEKCNGFTKFEDAILDIIRQKNDQQAGDTFTKAGKVEDYIRCYVTFPGNGSGVRRLFFNGSKENWEEELSLMVSEVFFYAPGSCVGFPPYDQDEEF